MLGGGVGHNLHSFLQSSFGGQDGRCFLFIEHRTGCKSTEAVFKENHGVWYPMLELTITSPYLIVNSVVGYLPPLQKKGVEWGRSLVLVEHICICLRISKTVFLGKHKYSEGVRADLMFLN
jgi:hypothetical protein